MDSRINVLLLTVASLMLRTQGNDVDLRQLVEELSQQMTTMRQEVMSSSLEMARLRSQVESYKQQLIEMKENDRDSKEEISRLKSQTDDFRREIINLRSRLESSDAIQDKQITDLKAKLEGINQKNNTEFIGFTAYATQPVPYGVGEQMMFDAVVTNYGASYYPDLSLFQCRVPGYYLFSVHVFTERSTHLKAEIYVTDAGEGPWASTYSDFTEDDHSSTSLITYCDDTQFVWVRNTLDGAWMFGDFFEGISSFSGVLLSANV